MTKPTKRLDDDLLLQRLISDALRPLADKIDRLEGRTYDKGYLDQRFTQLERDIRDLKDSLGKSTEREMSATERTVARWGGLIGAIGGIVAIMHYVKF